MLYQSEQRQAWHKCGLPPLTDAEISSRVLFHEKASGAGPKAVLCVPVTPAAAEDEGPVVSASQRTDVALLELYCFANPSSYVLRMSVVGFFIKCM